MQIGKSQLTTDILSILQDIFAQPKKMCCDCIGVPLGFITITRKKNRIRP